MHGQSFCWCLIAAVAVTSVPGFAQRRDERALQRFEQTLRQEGEAVIALADAAEAGRSPAADLTIQWHHDFFKATSGTFIPFIVTVAGAELRVPAVLLYVRLSRRGAGARPSGDRHDGSGGSQAAYAVEEIFPVDVPEGEWPVRISRGLSAQPGEYNLTVVARERDRGTAGGRRRAAVLQRLLRVPDLRAAQLTTSTIMLANRLTPLAAPPRAETLLERPYTVGLHHVERRLDPVFRRGEELIVVFLVYHPSVTPDKHFDLEVEYHFFRSGGVAAGMDGRAAGGSPSAAQPGEHYVNRTEPQRFNPMVLGPQFEPLAGQPILAGQRVPLADFATGDYRLAITVTDLVGGHAIAREVFFSVRS